jgi:hypothetical protein
MKRRLFYQLVTSIFFLSCTSGAGAPSEVDDLVPPDGKFDTGYFSTLAVELEGAFTSAIEIDVSGQSEEEVQEIIGGFQVYPQSLDYLIDLQVKLTKNQLSKHKLHINLTTEGVEVGGFEHEGDLLKIPYTVPVETLVTYEELSEVGVTPESLVNQSFDLSVAGDPRDLFTRVADSCASGYSAGSLNDSNYFYYFDPSLATCAVPMASNSKFSVRALLPFHDTYPEYDRLVADGRIEAVVVFGEAEHNAVMSNSDWGVLNWRTFEVNIRLRGFKMVPGLAVGQRYERERGGLIQVIDLISPYDLHDLGDAAFSMFAEMLRTHEIVFYNGHSFYGSLNVLNERSNYPEDTYQILFMNSCWSYEYYTKQVFWNKTSDEDPKGWDLADVINNTTTARFTQMEMSSRVILTNLFAGAESMGMDDMGRRFSWQRIIGIVNDEAHGICPVDADPMDCRHYQEQFNPEFYGVSGVRTNRFQP